MKDFDAFPIYPHHDLGYTYSQKSTTLKVWAPSASRVTLRLYNNGTDGKPLLEQVMDKSADGVWNHTLDGNQHGRYYTVQAYINGQWKNEVADPYAKAVGVNGKRAMIVDLAKTNPEGWHEIPRPPLAHFTDIVIYELHLRDLSIHPKSGIEHKGKYLGLAEAGTKIGEVSTGLDHLVAMGVTHVHLLPFFDFRSIDETKLHLNKYNWGYDPQNYNVPEGSYATDPFNGISRITELKSLIAALHKAGIRVIMDVVYNHTGATEESNFNQLVPGYYYRQNATGGFSDASACGNETASERPMMRNFMLASVKYWAEEYKIDGFRFDLMGIHDIQTMNDITTMLHAIDPTIYVYGEGWTAADSPLPVEKRAVKANTAQLEKTAAFCDELRDGVKGHWYDEQDKGFVAGAKGKKESIKFGVVAAVDHPQIDFELVNYSDAAWAREPWQTINYVSCHDNHTLWDKLSLTNPKADEATLQRMHKLAQTIVMTSQGVPFLHAGTEFYRTKRGVENSYQSPDSINWLDWTRKADHMEAVAFYRQLIRLRKSLPALRMMTADQVRDHLKFIPTDDDLLIAFQISGYTDNGSQEDLIIIYNGSPEEKSIELPIEKNWTVLLENHHIDITGLRIAKQSQQTIAPIAALVLKRAHE